MDWLPCTWCKVGKCQKEQGNGFYPLSFRCNNQKCHAFSHVLYGDSSYLSIWEKSIGESWVNIERRGGKNERVEITRTKGGFNVKKIQHQSPVDIYIG